MLDPSEARWRDSIVIELSAQESLHKGEPPADIVAHLSAQPIGLSHSLEGRGIEAPLILLEGDRASFGIEEFYFDPPAIGEPIPLGLYLPKWGGFARLLLSSKIVGDIRQSDYAYTLVSRAVGHCRQARGVAAARTLVQSLHDNRWLLGPEMAAQLFDVAGMEPPADGSTEAASRHASLAAEIASVRTLLTQAKQSCQDLTQWCELLYRINPRVWALLIHLRQSDLPDAEKWYRYFAEVDADIAPCSIRNVFSAIRAQTGKDGASWRALFTSEREETQDAKQFREKLQFLLHTRTTIPQFWFDLAEQSYDVPEDKLPAALDAIDAWRAVSTDVLRAASMTWRSGLNAAR